MAINPPTSPAPAPNAAPNAAALLQRQVQLTYQLTQRLDEMNQRLEEIAAAQRQVTGVAVQDIRMDFASMIGFMVKWSLASIPAAILLAIIGFLFFLCGTVFLTGVGMSL